MRDLADRIRCIGEHRGIGLHDCQSEERLAVVRRELDVVLELNDITLLTEICGDPTWSPEARLTAAAKLRAVHELAAEDRAARPAIDLKFAAACVAGLNSQKWRSPWHFCSLLDPSPAPGAKGPVRREPPL